MKKAGLTMRAMKKLNRIFRDADIELKVTSFLINSRGYRAKERLSLGKINYKDEN